jgi:hypothetical protein
MFAWVFSRIATRWSVRLVKVMGLQYHQQANALIQTARLDTNIIPSLHQSVFSLVSAEMIRCQRVRLLIQNRGRVF